MSVEAAYWTLYAAGTPYERRATEVAGLYEALLMEAVERYGPPASHHHKSVNFIFSEDERPCIIIHTDDVSIKLDSCSVYPQRLLFQLSHETIHILDPLGKANYLEEGAATIFSEEIMKRIAPDYPIRYSPSYDFAATLFRYLISLRLDSIKAVRMQQPRFQLITVADIFRAVPRATEELAAALCKPFPRS